MGVNRDKVDLWKADVARSVDFYNEWFMAFAPNAFRETRIETTKRVERALLLTENLTNIRPKTLQANPSVLPMLRMATCPPIARDRLIGLAGVSPNLVRKSNNFGKPTVIRLHLTYFYAAILILVTWDMKRLKVSTGFGNIGLTI